MLCNSICLLASLLAAATASPCTLSRPPNPVLPSTGTGKELNAPDSAQKLLKIAVGHGIQNYTCDNSSAPVKATGALAVLYDVTGLYPGMPVGLSNASFANLPNTVLWSKDLPLRLQNPDAAAPGSPEAPNVLPESEYGAVVDGSSPFPDPEELPLDGIASINAPFLGHHFFDSAGTPTFDLSTAAGLYGSVKKAGDVVAPSSANTGILGTGAVDWLQLVDNGKGVSKGIQTVYRVTTAGGVSQSCTSMNSSAGSVPYTAFYWFYG